MNLMVEILKFDSKNAGQSRESLSSLEFGMLSSRLKKLFGKKVFTFLIQQNLPKASLKDLTAPRLDLKLYVDYFQMILF